MMVSMSRARRRPIDRIADASVLLPAALGSLVLVGDLVEYGRECGGASVFAMLAFLSAVLHIWFRAEDRWRDRRLLREARRRRLRESSAEVRTPGGCGSAAAVASP
jgi:hypothetical protein